MTTLMWKVSFLFSLVVNVVPGVVVAELKQGFYTATCPQAEKVVQEVVAKHIAADAFITPGLLRMHFHDCFVLGCDASVLIDSTPEQKSEKATGPNFTVRGYEVIDEAKQALEAACPGIVSCADIIVLATRDAIAISGGPKFDIPTGRRDGLISIPENVNLPGPHSTVEEASQIFVDKGYTKEDMVVLLGAHTVGISHCMFFADRVADGDPDMDPALAQQLKQICESKKSPTDKPTAFLDQNTSMVFDNEYYNQLLKKRGLLKVDQNLAADPSTIPLITTLANDPAAFNQKFAEAFVKLSGTEVLVDDQGEIRKNCRVFNDPKAAAAAATADEISPQSTGGGAPAAGPGGAAAAVPTAGPGGAAAAVPAAAGGGAAEPAVGGGGAGPADGAQPATRKLRSD